MNNLIVLPIIIPFLTGIFLIFFAKHVVLQRTLSILSIFATIFVAIIVGKQIMTDGIQTLTFGGWPLPYGIAFVADMLAIVLVITANIVALAALIFSFSTIGEDREKSYFYPLFQFMLLGVVGAFLTGDIFNLFVFFEVLLIASYVLIIIGGNKAQFRETIKYVIINIVSSTLFLIAVAYLYAVTGSLNMADLAQRIHSVEGEGILLVIAILFFLVFAMKGALFPLYFWLPGSYTVPPSAIAALFGGLLTKVGVYAIIRSFLIIFGMDSGFVQPFFFVIAGLTMVFGIFGAIASKDVRSIVAYNVIVAVGFMLMGVAFGTTTAIQGTIFYMVHDMIIKAGLFLLAGTIGYVASTHDYRQMGGLIKSYPALGWTFFLATLSLAGIPPFSGFVGKLLLIEGGFEVEQYLLVGISIAVSFLILYSLMRIFIHGFWGVSKLKEGEPRKAIGSLLFPSIFLVTLSIILGLGAEWFMPVFETIAKQLSDPTIYIDAVLKG